jgi:hypothetical protein
VSLKVVLNLCHKIGFEVAKLPPQTRWRRPRYILSLSPAELRGAKRLGQGRALRARRKAAALPRPARHVTNPCRVRGGAAGTSRFLPRSTYCSMYYSTYYSMYCSTYCSMYYSTYCSTYCNMYCGGEPAGSRSPPRDAILKFLFLFLKKKLFLEYFNH